MPAKKRSTKTNSPESSVAPAVSPEGAPLAAAEGSAETPQVKKSAPKKAAKSVEAGSKTVVAKAAAPKAAAPKSAKNSKSIAAAPTVMANDSTDLADVPNAVVVAPSPARRTVTEEEIRQRAFFLSLQRRGSHDPIADWLEAERSLRSQTA